MHYIDDEECIRFQHYNNFYRLNLCVSSRKIHCNQGNKPIFGIPRQHMKINKDHQSCNKNPYSSYQYNTIPFVVMYFWFCLLSFELNCQDWGLE